jgi:hypothetical protein
MSYIADAEGNPIWDVNSEFTPEELTQINAAGVTVPELREWYTKFPHQNLENAINGLLDHQKHLKSGGVEGLKSEADDVVPEEIAKPTLSGELDKNGDVIEASKLSGSDMKAE